MSRSASIVGTPLTDALVRKLRAGKPVAIEEALALAKRLERGLRRIEITNLHPIRTSPKQTRTVLIVRETLDDAAREAEQNQPDEHQPGAVTTADIYDYVGRKARAR